MWLILIVVFSLFVVWRFFAALIMLQFAIKSGNAHGKRFGYFIMCFLLGLPAYLYVISLPDWKVRFYLHKILWLLESNTLKKQPSTNPPLKFSNWQPETPTKDGFAEAFLREIAKTPEEYTCDRLIIVKEVPAGECFVCKRKRKTIKTCRIIHNGTHKDANVCIDCINVFVNYNHGSVFDLEALEPKQS